MGMGEAERERDSGRLRAERGVRQEAWSPDPGVKPELKPGVGCFNQLRHPGAAYSEVTLKQYLLHCTNMKLSFSKEIKLIRSKTKHVFITCYLSVAHQLISSTLHLIWHYYSDFNIHILSLISRYPFFMRRLRDSP